MHLTVDGSQYVRITFGLPASGTTVVDPSNVIDAEFVFLEGKIFLMVEKE